MKLTVKNYKEATKNIDFKKLPEAAQEAHKEFDSFADFYNEDKDIKEMLKKGNNSAKSTPIKVSASMPIVLVQ